MMKRIFYILTGLALLGSCVPAGEFSQLTDKSNSLQGERDELMAENEQLTVENREMRAKIDQVAELDGLVGSGGVDAVRRFAVQPVICAAEPRALRRYHADHSPWLHRHRQSSSNHPP